MLTATIARRQNSLTVPAAAGTASRHHASPRGNRAVFGITQRSSYEQLAEAHRQHRRLLQVAAGNCHLAGAWLWCERLTTDDPAPSPARRGSAGWP